MSYRSDDKRGQSPKSGSQGKYQGKSQGAGSKSQGGGPKSQGAGAGGRSQGSGFKSQGAGFKSKDSGFKYQDSKPSGSKYQPKGRPDSADRGDRPARPERPAWQQDRPARPDRPGRPESARPDRAGKPDRYGKPDRPAWKQDRPARPERPARTERPFRTEHPEYQAGRHDAEEMEYKENPYLLIGRNPVKEALKSDREIEKIFALKDAEGSVKQLLGQAGDKQIPIHFTDRVALDRISGGKSHQGIIAFVSPVPFYELEDLLAAAVKKGEDPFLILLDGIEDPHNLGAIIRSVDGAGAHGVVITKRRAAGISDVVAKASAGAVEYVPVARVSNLVQAMETLKAKGIWIGAVDVDGTPYHQKDLKGPIALVIGGEGHGISRIVKENCDFTVSIPMKGKVSSLNASNAAAILLYEINRQRA